MPRIYVTPAEVSESPLGIGLSSSISTLGTGVLDKLLARASQKADNYCEKRLQAPGATTLSSNVSAGATSISVASTLTLDNLAEQAVIVDYGNGLQETIEIQPGGVTVSSWISPYPGTIALKSPLQFSHSSGAVVQFAYKEVKTAGRSSTGDPYSEALQSQAAQLALAHLPPVHVGLTRNVFLNNYPIIQVLQLEHSYSFAVQYNTIDISSGLSIESTAGFFRVNIGTVITPEGLLRTTYLGGYEAIPDDIKDAVLYYLTDDLQKTTNPYMATDTQLGKRRVMYTLKNGKTPAAQQAEAILDQYRRRI